MRALAAEKLTSMSDDRATLTVRDNRTGKEYEIPIADGKVDATAFRDIRGNDAGDTGLMVMDHGYVNTACCKSSITEVDGAAGRLAYRGYAIEELVEKSTFLEVAFLLLFGELPTEQQLKEWEWNVMRHTFIHENLATLLKSFRYDAHPMGVLISCTSALSTFYPEANPALQHPALYSDEKILNKQIFRILGKIPTIAACAYRHRIGRPYNSPKNGLSYTENFLFMLDSLDEQDFVPNAQLARVLDKLFILHADHELNCSTATMRQVGSSLVDPYTGVASAAGALYGPRHGGANEAVLRMLAKIGSPDKVPGFLEDVKAKRCRLMGFGHRLYKTYDPRAKIVRKLCDEVFEILGKNKLVEVAEALEQHALADEYFTKRRLFPNVDFYSGLIYQTMGFPTDMFPVLFSIPRTAGWLAHWKEQVTDPSSRIFRPRQVYTGASSREYAPVEARELAAEPSMNSYSTSSSIRRSVAVKSGSQGGNHEHAPSYRLERKVTYK